MEVEIQEGIRRDPKDVGDRAEVKTSHWVETMRRRTGKAVCGPTQNQLKKCNQIAAKMKKMRLDRGKKNKNQPDNGAPPQKNATT